MLKIENFLRFHQQERGITLRGFLFEIQVQSYEKKAKLKKKFGGVLQTVEYEDIMFIPLYFAVWPQVL